MKLGEVRVEADVVTDTGIEHRTTVMPVLANLDGEDHVEPEVEHTFLRFQAAKAREDAVRLADGGEFDRAAAGLEAAAASLAPIALGPGMAEEIEDLQREAGRLRGTSLRGQRPEVPGRSSDGRPGAQGRLRLPSQPAAAQPVSPRAVYDDTGASIRGSCVTPPAHLVLSGARRRFPA